MNRFILGATTLVTSIVIGTATSASASGPYGSASYAERRQCSATSYHQSSTQLFHVSYDLRGPAGNRRPDIGRMEGYGMVDSNGNGRSCWFVVHGSRTWGHSAYTLIQVGTVPRGGGEQTVLFYDRYTYSKYTQARAVTPGSGRCGVARGYMSVGGTAYQVWVNQDDFVYHPNWICNS